MIEERALCVYQIQISPEYLHEHTKPSLEMDNEKDEQSCNQSQHIEKPIVRSEGLNQKE